MALIEAENLVKEFTITPKGRGLAGSLRALVRPRRRQVLAVNDISFRIEPGESVGYIGPNGAGKSTTVKMLSGILHPTRGSVRVLGLSPQANRKAVVRHLGVVFGQRTQLYWDLRLGESFELMRKIYRIPDAVYRDNLALVSKVLRTGELADTPVRQLSLGQRMRGDLAAAMLHAPPILILDEPTIGLDILAKQAVRDFILELNRQRGTTVLLTTHDLGDVEKLCRRLMVINRGCLIEDAPLQTLMEKLAPHRILQVDFESPLERLAPHPDAEVVNHEGIRVTLKFDRRRITAAELIAHVTKHHTVRDLAIVEPEIEDVIAHYYRESAPHDPLTQTY
ncbi:MAG: ATP-binding cassette domain-containing protein [Lentisphaerota bacterium]